jgi:hypothetical protein
VTNKTSFRKFRDNEVDFSLVSVLPDSVQIDTVELLPNELYMMVNAEQTFEKIFIRFYFRGISGYLSQEVLGTL